MPTVSIADQIKILIQLQQLDGRIYQMRKDLKAKPAQTLSLKARFQSASTLLKAEGEKAKIFEVKRNQMEMDLSQKETQIKKLQTQLYSVKTNKEYQALQKEIEGLKADRSVLEEEILKIMEEVDQAKKRVSGEKEKLKVLEGEINQGLAQLEEEARSIEKSIHEREAARGELTPKVDPPLLSQYERILDRKEGLAIVPVRGTACGGCHMVLPPQMINEIQMAPRLIVCESCARILTIEPAE